MKNILTSVLFIILILNMVACGSKNKSESEEKKTDDIVEYTVLSGKVIPADTYGEGENLLYVTLIGHGSLMFEYREKIIHVDPYSKVADYSKLPKADLILLTHEHADHLDQETINLVKKDDTRFIMSQSCYDILKYGDVLNNGDITHFNNFIIATVPAYNIKSKRPDGEYYHPKGRGNGYTLHFEGTTVYVAGDTENIPEMESLKGSIDIAFLPKNLPYTMSDNMFIDAAKKVMPKHLYPYHMSEFNNNKISKALEGTEIKLEVRPMSNL